MGLSTSTTQVRYRDDHRSRLNFDRMGTNYFYQSENQQPVFSAIFRNIQSSISIRLYFWSCRQCLLSDVFVPLKFRTHKLKLY